MPAALPSSRPAQRTIRYASQSGISGVLHSTLFEQPPAITRNAMLLLFRGSPATPRENRPVAGCRVCHRGSGFLLARKGDFFYNRPASAGGTPAWEKVAPSGWWGEGCGSEFNHSHGGIIMKKALVFCAVILFLLGSTAVAAELRVGAKAPDFNFKDSKGKAYSLNSPELAGKVVFDLLCRPGLQGHEQRGPGRPQDGSRHRAEHEIQGTRRGQPEGQRSSRFPSQKGHRQQAEGSARCDHPHGSRLLHAERLGPHEQGLQRDRSRQAADLPLHLQGQASEGRDRQARSM